MLFMKFELVALEFRKTDAFTNLPIFAKVDVNFTTLIQDTTMTLENEHCNQIQMVAAAVFRFIISKVIFQTI